jgi:hypothetical protein
VLKYELHEINRLEDLEGKPTLIQAIQREWDIGTGQL